MNFFQIRIKNYRSISEEINLNFKNRTTIIGPNNSGKTNIVSAIQTFFSGLDKNLYEVKRDSPIETSGKQTSIIASFLLDGDSDSDFIDLYSQMQDCLEAEKRQDSTFQLFLYYSTAGKPVYQFFPNAKIKNKATHNFRVLHLQALQLILGKFSCKVIPSVKDPEELFSKILLPFIKCTVAEVLHPHLPQIKSALDEISDSINAVLELAKLKKIQVAIDVAENIDSMLSNFNFYIDDGIKTSASSKGSGVQAATILASLKWVGLEEKKNGRETIWLLEEPESYLHPELAKCCVAIIEDLSELNCVILTTHAISFVGNKPEQIYEATIGGGVTTVKQCQTYSEATSSIRKSLGLRYSDFFQLGKFNLLVEGVSDREILSWAINQIKPNKGKNNFPMLRQATIIDFTGVSSLKDFLKHSYDFIRNEVSTFIIFDGDEAGVEAANALNRFFSNKSIPFGPNRDYAVLPKGFPIEGLFPNDFIVEMYENHPGWFSNFNADIHGKVLAFSLKDGSKGSMQRAMMTRAEKETAKTGNYAWAKEFIGLFNIAETQLALKAEQIYPSGN